MIDEKTRLASCKFVRIILSFMLPFVSILRLSFHGHGLGLLNNTDAAYFHSSHADTTLYQKGSMVLIRSQSRHSIEVGVVLVHSDVPSIVESSCTGPAPNAWTPRFHPCVCTLACHPAPRAASKSTSTTSTTNSCGLLLSIGKIHNASPYHYHCSHHYWVHSTAIPPAEAYRRLPHCFTSYQSYQSRPVTSACETAHLHLPAEESKAAAWRRCSCDGRPPCCQFASYLKDSAVTLRNADRRLDLIFHLTQTRLITH